MKSKNATIILHVIFCCIVVAAYFHLDKLYKLQQIANAVDRVHTSMLYAETSQRGFLLDDDPQYLSDYEYNRKLLVVRLDFLCSLIPKTKENGTLCIKLGQLVERKINEMQSIIDEEKQGHHQAALKIFKTNVGLDYRNEIDKLVNKIQFDGSSKKMAGCLVLN